MRSDSYWSDSEVQSFCRESIGMWSKNYWNEEREILKRGNWSMEREVTSRATVM